MWEVVYPHSRAVDLDTEDDEFTDQKNRSSRPIVHLSRKFQNDSSLSCALLVMAFDRIPTTFIEANFINKDSDIVGVVSSGVCKDEIIWNSLKQTSNLDKTCFIYSATNNREILLCQCKVKVSEEISHDWVKEVSICCLCVVNVLLLDGWRSTILYVDIMTLLMLL